ncbi:hypothetical protein EI94DRAFT_1701116 [Lactarius quietus]|nr:hypothetical protein EI94DRAFT_1703681 [Lactarius quietus]KAF8267311.1 hypothetical protein EI94DRAFT_1701116 [Lactarius quietus]
MDWILEFYGASNPEILAKIGVKPKIDLPSVQLKDLEKYNTLNSIADETGRQKGAGSSISGTRPLAREAYPSIAEQHQLQLDKLRANAASLELINMPNSHAPYVLSAPIEPAMTIMQSKDPPEPRKKYFTILTVFNHPSSRGTIHATSPDPFAPPALDLHRYEDEFDLWNIVELVKVSHLDASSERPLPIIDRRGTRRVNSAVHQLDRAYAPIHLVPHGSDCVKDTSETCSMFPRDKCGVVDPRLKVSTNQSKEHWVEPGTFKVGTWQEMS